MASANSIVLADGNCTYIKTLQLEVSLPLKAHPWYIKLSLWPSYSRLQSGLYLMTYVFLPLYSIRVIFSLEHAYAHWGTSILSCMASPPFRLIPSGLIATLVGVGFSPPLSYLFNHNLFIWPVWVSFTLDSHGCGGYIAGTWPRLGGH